MLTQTVKIYAKRRNYNFYNRVIMLIKMIVIFFTIFMSVGGKTVFGGTSVKEYDPIYCLQVLNSLFNPIEKETTCDKTAELIECANQFFPSASDHVIIKGLQSILEEGLCSELYEEDSVNVNKCLSQERFFLFSCVFKYLNLQVWNSYVEPKQLNCRRAWDTMNCEDLIVPCPARASHISRFLFHKLVLLMTASSSCGSFSWPQIQDLHPEPLNTEYDQLALCLDEERSTVTRCLSEALSAEFPKKTSNHCRPIDPLVGCVKVIVQNHCAESLDKFDKVVRLLRQQIEQTCHHSNEIIQPMMSATAGEKNGVVSSAAVSSRVDVDTNSEEDQSNTEDIPPTTGKNPLHTYSNKFPEEFFSSRVQEGLKSTKVQSSSNTSETSSNSTDPIVIHKHTLVYIYRNPKPKNSSPISFNLFNGLIGALVFMQYLNYLIMR